MTNLKDVDFAELRARYLYLIDKYVNLAADLAPMMNKFGKYREELQFLTAEFVSRGESVEDPDSLVKKILKELEEEENDPKPDSI